MKLSKFARDTYLQCGYSRLTAYIQPLAMHSLSRLSILSLSGAQSIRESSGIVCESAVPAERSAKSKTGGKPEEKVGY